MNVVIVACSWCRLPLTPGQALEVVSAATGAMRYVHRPSIRLDGIPAGRCLHLGTSTARGDRIALADPDAAREHDRATP